MGVRLKTDPNRPPVILDTIDQTFEIGVPKQLSFANLASDPDGDATTVSMNLATVPLPAGFTYNSVTGVLSWSGSGPSGVSSGHTLRADDGELISVETAQFSLTVPTPPASSDTDGHPRLCGFRIGTQDWGVSPEVDQISKLHWVWINAHARNGSAFVDAKEAAITNLLALNPKLTIYDYTDLMETTLTGYHSAKIDAFVHSVTGDGWVYDEAGNKVSTFGNSFNVNITSHLNNDGSGDKYPGYYAKDVQTQQLDPHNTAAPSSYRCHIGDDVFNHRPLRNSLDYNRSGTNDRGFSDWNKPGTRGFDAADEWREGHKIYIEDLKAANPGMLVMGNTHTWGTETKIIDPADPDYPPLPHNHYGNLLNGGLMESQTGWPGEWDNPLSGIYGDRSLNPSGFGSYRRAVAAYLYLMRAIIAPKHVGMEFRVELTTNSLNPIVGTDISSDAMAVARFAMCMTWMDDGYVFIADENTHHNKTPLFDEMGVSGNEPSTGLTREWFDDPIDSAQHVIEENTGESAIWIGADEDGVMKREHLNALVMLTTKKSTSGFIDIPIVPGGSLAGGNLPDGEWWEILGTQNSAINRGIRVTTANPEFSSGFYRLNNIDGRVLVRHGYSIYNSGLRL